uniref:Squamosa promoter-binding-like protein 15 n=2 Tax=Anthurium amnicola TaxID=1678845 RepID=A0A1D1Y3W2_9ARAE
MDGEVGAQVAAPIFLHGRFHEVPALARKRDLAWQSANFHLHQHPQQGQQRLAGSGYSNLQSNWNPKLWDWDSGMFVAKPAPNASDGGLRLGNPAGSGEVEQKEDGEDNLKDPALVKRSVEEENLTLKLGGGPYTVEEPVVRPNKRVRSGSPGNGGSYPMCQVDDCKADLSNAKDYHRRHKVCEVHSKTTKAMVGKQMQRFCQQCSRFHILSEFDEGKRSCRRRLAGHNRRRRKSQPEDPSSRLLAPANRESSGCGNLDIVNLLAILARWPGHGMEKPNPLHDKDRLSQILSKIKSLPNLNASAMLPKPGGFDLNVSQTSEDPPERLSITDGKLSAPSVDLLAALSTALKVPGLNMDAASPQGSSDGSANGKTKVNCLEPAADVNSQTKLPTFSPISVQRSSCAPRSSTEISEHPVAQTRSNLPLQLFSSTDDDSPPKTGSSRKYLSSESSNPMEDRSPSSSPPIVHRLFPLQSGTENLKRESTSTCREDNGMFEASTCRGWGSPLDLFKNSQRRVENRTVLNLPYQAGYTSSSGSDHSPSSSHSDAQDRTGRIIFKLFGKDPSCFPVTLREQILSWLSHSPSDMESYIRPGCVVLSVYLSMPSFAWDELQEDLLQRVNLLVQHTDSGFWRNGRFLVHTDRQLASHKDGKIRLCKSWRTWSAPELISVSPLAVVSGKKTSLVLRGRNLTVPGTKIHCTYMGGYTSKEVLGSAYPGTIYDDSSIEMFNFPGGVPNVFGRFFIEVENGFKGNSFPVIIAEDVICEELRLLESEVEVDLRSDMIHDDQAHDCRQPRSREDALHFLNELGWLFQRHSTQLYPLLENFSDTRFKFLFIFSVERDLSALVKKLLDVLVQNCSLNNELIQESLDVLSEIQLLHRAVKRKCRKMVNLLLHYSVSNGTDASKVYLFPPNLNGPGGVSPLHLAASMEDSEDVVDGLTDDPQEIGLNCWTSLVDDNGQSPYTYASMRNNNSYNRLVARKLADRRNGQVSIAIDGEDVTLGKAWASRVVDKPGPQSPQVMFCSRCAIMETRRIKTTLRPQGLLQRPYINSILAIAAVCVCVCLFLRGAPELGSVDPFTWENLGCGTS